MPKSLYAGGKFRRHFTLSNQASNHLNSIAHSALLSRSETLERLIRATSSWEGGAMFNDQSWPFVTDYTDEAL
jgi:hypothetical protein